MERKTRKHEDLSFKFQHKLFTKQNKTGQIQDATYSLS
jgi:hypothetical protein